MNCKRCGKNNPPQAQRCAYCGTPLTDESKQHNSNQKQTESIIVAMIIMLVLLLVVVVGVAIYKHNHTRNSGYYGGRGGGPAYTTSTPTPVTASPTPTDNGTAEQAADEPLKKPDEKTEASEQPKQTEKPSASDKKMAKKDEFLGKAEDIEEYAEKYFEAARSQAELNNESGIVYEKWDALLNEVYQYLKTIMSESAFNNLKEDELKWIDKKEKAIEAAGEEWKGGSGEPMARNAAGIEYTRERCYYLISLIN